MRPEFTSTLSRREYILALGWLPVHMVLLPLLAGIAMGAGLLSEGAANFAIYVVGVGYMLLFLGRFLRRDFDAICDRPLFCLLEICSSYFWMLLANMAVNGLLMLLMTVENPNNAAVFEMAGKDFGLVSAMAICLAPIVEEIIFRAGIFGLARKRSRVLAYVLSILCFSMYHVWGYLQGNLMNLIYLLQYLPVSFLLCRCYERTNSIWASIFFHMLVNYISFNTMEALLLWIV